ncbi:MAG: hypothetical protein JWP91_3087 [Fibrobacteres bacterium]|nr:hypothetical protein [Fibrobacterota bacterium]
MRSDRSPLKTGLRSLAMMLSVLVVPALVLAGLVSPIHAQKTTVVIFFIDGLEPASAKLMAANGAANLKFMFDSGVVAEKSFTPYPKEGYKLENGTAPWGNTSPGNVACHNGCHIFESKNVDDIFLAAREKGIKSVYAGGSANYSEITTPDFHYSGELTDEAVVQHGIDHFQKDKARLIRLHPQRIRDGWTGPAGIPDPASSYNKAILAVDAQLGLLIKALKAGGVWDSTYLIVAADHGMNNNTISLHDADQLNSWIPFMSFYGPGIKKGQTIPYAELSDVAIMADYFLGLRPLKGVLDPAVTITPKGPTGSFLSNLFIGSPKELNHPRYVERFLEAVAMKPKADYVSYRNTMLPILKQFTPVDLGEQIRREMDMQRSPERFAIRSLPGGGMSIVAPYLFDRVELLGLDGRSLFSSNAPATASLELPGLPMGSAPVLVRLRRNGGAVTQALTLAPR